MITRRSKTEGPPLATVAPSPETVPLKRYADYVARLQRLGAGARRADSNRLLLVAGGILVPLGIFLVLLGWLGAARTPLVFEQIPYLISGGLLGLGLMLLGGLVYFSYWLTLLVRETRQERRELIAILASMRGGAGPPAEDAPPADDASPVGDEIPSVDDEALVVTARGSMVHRQDCPVVAGRQGLRTVAGDLSRFSVCRVCKPSGVAPTAGTRLQPRLG